MCMFERCTRVFQGWVHVFALFAHVQMSVCVHVQKSVCLRGGGGRRRGAEGPSLGKSFQPPFCWQSDRNAREGHFCEEEFASSLPKPFS